MEMSAWPGSSLPLTTVPTNGPDEPLWGSDDDHVMDGMSHSMLEVDT